MRVAVIRFVFSLFVAFRTAVLAGFGVGQNTRNPVSRSLMLLECVEIAGLSLAATVVRNKQ